MLEPVADGPDTFLGTTCLLSTVWSVPDRTERGWPVLFASATGTIREAGASSYAPEVTALNKVTREAAVTRNGCSWLALPSGIPDESLGQLEYPIHRVRRDVPA